MNKFLTVIGLGLGLALGGGGVYAFAVNESVRLITMFLLGAFLFGVTILLTALLVNRQWSRVIGEQKTTHHHSYRLNGPSNQPVFEPPERQQELLPPAPQEWQVWPAASVDSENETIA